jgi:hypothetical protein
LASHSLSKLVATLCVHEHISLRFKEKNNTKYIQMDYVVEDGIDVDSDEEKEIMKEIKNEIQQQIRGEMKSELEMYQYKMAALENGSVRGEDANKESGLEDMEPKMKAAILKMRKLDTT